MAHLVLLRQPSLEKPPIRTVATGHIGKQLHQLDIIPAAVYVPATEIDIAHEQLSAALGTHNPLDPPQPADELNPRKFGPYITGYEHAQRSLSADNVDKAVHMLDFEPRGGESLRAVQARVMALHETRVLQKLMEGTSVLVLADADPIRAYMHGLAKEAPEKISATDIAPGQAAIYDFRLSKARHSPSGFIDTPKPRKSPANASSA
jgi:broad specificity phosphatase PhoE